MQARYAQYQIENGVLPLPAGYSQMRQLVTNTVRARYTDAVLILLLSLLVLLPFLVAYRMRVNYSRQRATPDDQPWSKS
jgi:arylsulfatase/uncharacterized sulfatase